MPLSAIFLALTWIQTKPSTDQDKSVYPSPKFILAAMVAGRWDRVSELLPEWKEKYKDQRDGAMSYLCGFVGADDKYANVLTGIRIAKEAGANPNGDNGHALYIAAMGDRHGQVVERLLKYGADPNHRYFYPDAIGKKDGGAPPLSVAGNPKTVEFLFKYKANPNFIFSLPPLYKLGYSAHVTPLMQATMLPTWQPVVIILLNNGAKPDVKCPENGMTALHFAAQFDYDVVAKQLVKAGASKKQKDKKGRTPIMVAKQYRSKKVIKALGG